MFESYHIKHACTLKPCLGMVYFGLCTTICLLSMFVGGERIMLKTVKRVVFKTRPRYNTADAVMCCFNGKFVWKA